MNLLKEVLKKQVYPALGCTEPVSVALCAATAAKTLGQPPEKLEFFLDAATYKNGMAVSIPNTEGEMGNLLAGTIGALIARPELGMQVLSAATAPMVRKAKILIGQGKAKIVLASNRQHGIFIKVSMRAGRNKAMCVISGTHTHVSLLTLNGKEIINAPIITVDKNNCMEKHLARQTLKSLLALADKADANDMKYIKTGVEMNLAASRAGMELKKVGHYLLDLLKRGHLTGDVFASSKILAACATDARMAGLPVPVMSSGESGNQGIVASLVPYNVGKTLKVRESKIYKSIALSHLLNSYVKVFTGGLAPICGCAIGAGVGASAAIVYQMKGADTVLITLAINNLISDLGGMLCDGAKSGCSLKVVSAADSAIRSAYMAMDGYGITQTEGFVGKTAEETIQNLAQISIIGMGKADLTMLNIMHRKTGNRR